MYSLEVSAAVRHIYMSLGFKRLKAVQWLTKLRCGIHAKFAVKCSVNLLTRKITIGMWK